MWYERMTKYRDYYYFDEVSSYGAGGI